MNNVRPLDCRIIDIVRKFRRPAPPEICGPMTEAIEWLYGKWDRPPGRWAIAENPEDHCGEWVWIKSV